LRGKQTGNKGKAIMAAGINILRRLRYFRYYKKFARCGANVLLSRNGLIYRPEQISLGNNVFISSGFRISAYQLRFGNNIMIGPNLVIECENHIVDRVGVPMMNYSDSKSFGPVTIEDDVWIGANVAILKNTTIREGAVVGACSLVNRDIPPYCIAFGVPARPHRPRFSNESLRAHLDLVGSRYSFEQVMDYFTAPDDSKAKVRGAGGGRT
jgi:acetyltransferase-like isoleucine patch superfamily enzyme